MNDKKNHKPSSPKSQDFGAIKMKSKPQLVTSPYVGVTKLYEVLFLYKQKNKVILHPKSRNQTNKLVLSFLFLQELSSYVCKRKFFEYFINLFQQKKEKDKS